MCLAVSVPSDRLRAHITIRYLALCVNIFLIVLRLNAGLALAAGMISGLC